MYRNDTIAAISTPRGKGGVALIRISGPEASDVACRCFFAKNGKNIAVMPPRVAVYGDILCRGGYKDSGIAVFYKAPHSFTGEDTVEITCHGGALITKRVLESVLACGARLANAGEFSHRALINGKLSLTEAEALSDVLSASTDAQLRVASQNTQGKLGRELCEIYSALEASLAALYAKIDFPDEDLADMSGEELLDTARSILARVSKLVSGYEGTSAIREGVPAVICGIPNAGKSSLYNALAGEELAIVTSEAGTTRDVLSQTLTVGSVILDLSDTAGVRTATDKVEAIGVERAIRALDNAALVLAMFDGSRELSADDRELADRLKNTSGALICIANKCDIGESSAIEELEQMFGEVIKISAKSGEGIDELREKIEKLFISDEIDLEKDVFLSGERQYSAAKSAQTYIENAIEALASGMPPDCSTTDLEAAMGAIGEMDGRSVNEEVVNKIFATFCVGK